MACGGLRKVSCQAPSPAPAETPASATQPPAGETATPAPTLPPAPAIPTLTPAIAAPVVVPSMTPTADLAPALQKRVDDLLARMTLAEKIGQMTLVEKECGSGFCARAVGGW